jgi:hypothetical protein
LRSDVQESQLNDTISRVSLHVVDSGGFSRENLETSILHTTSGGGIIVRKHHQPATFLSPHTIPLTHTTPEPPSSHQSIDNPFTVPELPILHQFHDVDAILKARPSKNVYPNTTLIHHMSESFVGDFAIDRKWMNNSSSDGYIDPRNPNLGKGSVSSASQHWAELHDITTPIFKSQHSLHMEAFPTRYFQQPALGDMGNKARLGNTNVPLKGIGIPSTATSLEASLSKVQMNKSTRVQFAALNPLADSVASTPFSIVTLIPVRSNSGVGRPLRPKPKIPSHTSLQVKNETEPMGVASSSEYTLRNKGGDNGYSSQSPTSMESDSVSGVKQAEISHNKQDNSAGFTIESDGAMISFNQSSKEAPEEEAQSMTLDHESQSSDIKHSTELTYSRLTSSVPQQISTLSPISAVTSSEMGTVPASIKVTQTQSPIKAVPLLSAVREATTLPTDKSTSEKLTISTQQSTTHKLITSPTKEAITLETTGTISPTIITSSPVMKTALLSTEPTTKVTKSLPSSSSLLPTTKSIQTNTVATLFLLTSSSTPKSKVNNSSSLNLASNKNHVNQINKTATDQIKNATLIAESMVRISPVSAMKQTPSTEEVMINKTAGITKSNNTNIKETSGKNISLVPSPDQKTPTTNSPSYFTQTSTVTVSKHSYPTVQMSSQPTIIYTTPSMFIPVIVIQDPPYANWHNNSHRQTEKIVSAVTTLEVPPNASNVPIDTGGQREDITRNTTAITYGPKIQENQSLRTTEASDNTNLTGNKQGQNILIIQKFQNNNNSSERKSESIRENINTAPQQNVVTPQAIILNTDTVTTTSIEVSFKEHTGKVSIDPLTASQSPNRDKYVDKNNTSTVDLSVTLSSALVEMTSTHKVKETRRKPKMKPTFIYAPLFENSRREERMMGSADNSKIETRTDVDFLVPKVADVTDTTNLNIFSSEENGRKNIAVTITEYEPENFNYRAHSDEPRTVFIKMNAMTEGPVTQHYSSAQVSSPEEEIILAKSNFTAHFTKEGSPQKEQLPFNSSKYSVVQDPVLQRINVKTILTTEEISSEFYNVSMPDDKILLTKELLNNTSSDALNMFENVTVTKVQTSSSMQDKRQPENFEMSADDIMYLLNATRNHSIMSPEAVNTLSKYAIVHTAISTNNISKNSQNNIYDDEDKIINDSTENYTGEKITNTVDTEEAKLSTKTILLHGSNIHAGIPILTKIYNKAPQQLGEKDESTEAGSPDLTNATGKWNV